jgi:hypothetical protein
MKINFVFLTLLLCICLITGQAQDEVRVPTTPTTSINNKTEPKEFDTFRDRIYIGGNVGASFGSTTYINIQPLIGCKITKKLSVGVGGTYNYQSQSYGGSRYVYTIYGANAFARYMILDYLFVQAGWDKLSVKSFNNPLITERLWVDNLLIGGGYRQPFSDKGAFVAAIFYNVNQGPNSPYQNPIIQIGFNIGL